MHAVLDDWQCPACGGRHTLGLLDHRDAWQHRDFEFD